MSLALRAFRWPISPRCFRWRNHALPARRSSPGIQTIKGAGCHITQPRALLFCLLLIFCQQLPVQAAVMHYTSELETFRFESTQRLEELYTLRGVYIDSGNTAATEGVQIFISEVRINVFLVNNVLDIVFLYGLHKDYDDKYIVREFVASRLTEIMENVRYNVDKVRDLSNILARQGQQTLSDDFYDYRAKLVNVLDAIKAIKDQLGDMQPHDGS